MCNLLASECCTFPVLLQAEKVKFKVIFDVFTEASFSQPTVLFTLAQAYADISAVNCVTRPMAEETSGMSSTFVELLVAVVGAADGVEFLRCSRQKSDLISSLDTASLTPNR